MKRTLGIGLAVVLLVGVVTAVVLGQGEDKPAQLTTVRGVIGSEKLAFFADQRVKDVFARHGLKVEVDPAGSRQIATAKDLDTYDFAFPSSTPAAERIQRDHKAARTYAPFSSPMVVATFDPIVELLTKAAVVKNGPGYRTFDVQAYLELAAKGTRWDQLPGNTSYPARKNLLVTTTDPRDSNSAAMYLAITSFVANGAVVSTPEAEAKVLPAVSKLFLDQGFTQSSSEGPFEDYLSAGMGKSPLVLAYEAQFVDRVVRGDSTVRPDMKLLYPAPTVLSKHTLVPLREAGDRIGQLLTGDAELGKLAATFGFRTSDPKYFNDVVKEKNLVAPQTIVDVVEPPEQITLVTDPDEEAGQLRAELDALVQRVRGFGGRVPGEVAPKLAEIAEVLRGMLDRPRELRADPHALHEVTRLVGTDLPLSVQSYLNLPWWYAAARGSGTELLRQLDLLKADAVKVASRFHEADAQRQADHGRYLEDRDS